MNHGRLSTHANQFPGIRSRQPWAHWLEPRLDRFFEIALLLSADPDIAEASIISVIDTFDCSHPPSPESARLVESTVAMVSIQRTLSSLVRNDIFSCAHLIQPELLPVLRLNPNVRICFVAIALLRYGAEWCAQLLGIAKSDVAELFSVAAEQLAAACELKQTSWK